ncbi:MAG: CHAT domain-containing protein [Deltaproteobacteria bacterium]|nr:CHAT domain-containing protein [Deltaproteobacteria bacterium]MBK8719703.1 CHAT domain-containing protein [Deltaproteobacteria bacterium]
MFVRPLEVQLCWSDRDRESVGPLARELYEFLDRPPGDDPVLRPGLGIATRIGCDAIRLVQALRVGALATVGVRVVVAMLASAGYADAGFRAAIEQLAANDGDDLVLVPVVLDPRWLDALSSVRGRTIELSAQARSEDDRRWSLGVHVGIEVARALLGPAGIDACPQISISHAAVDQLANDHLAARLHEHLVTRTAMRCEFNDRDEARAQQLRSRLRSSPRDALLLVIRTDAWSESPWCTEELLVAKSERVPILTVLATTAGEPRASAYAGNHRTVHWQAGREWEVAGRCVQAWLQHHHFLAFGRAALELAGLPQDSTVLSRRPELLDLSADPRALVVYPDPPMPEAERDVLRALRPDVRIATPSTLFGRVLLDRDTAPPLCGMTLAFSLSPSPTLPAIDELVIGAGLTQTHAQDALAAIVLASVHSGARVCFGGDFRRGGFAERLGFLLQAHRRLGLVGRPRLLCFLAEGRRSGDAIVEYEPYEVASPVGAEACDDVEVRSCLWHLAMRRASSQMAEARLVLGGRVRPRIEDGDGGYHGAWPGVLEEAYRTVQAHRALYLLGGFGGYAGELARRLDLDHDGPEVEAVDARVANLRERFEASRLQLAARSDADLDLLLIETSGPLREADLRARVRDAWRRFIAGDASAWPNGLDVAENRTLFTSTDEVELAQLVFTGVSRLRRRAAPAGEIRLRCYHGDIASIAGVDAYGVTLSPGLEPVGASAALDARCGGRLRRAVLARGVEVVAVHGAALAGRHVIVATLELPEAGAPLSVAAIEDAAAAVGGACARLGLTSLACPIFGATLGIAVSSALDAMRRGFDRAGAPAIVTFCEIDGGRVAELRAALPAGAFQELREGPLPSAPPRRTLLHLGGRAPTDETPGVIHARLFRDDLGAAVPGGSSGPIDADTWTILRTRVCTMDEALARGQLLFERLLPESVQRELCAERDGLLSLLVDDVAASLPWEALASVDPSWTPATSVPFSRRIALGDEVGTPAAATRRSGRLRFLLVFDAAGDLEGARDEALAVRTAMAARGDVDLVAFQGPAATLDAVTAALSTGAFDVFHYAGHARFDPTAPERSGLELADGVFTAAHVEDAHVPRLVVLGACESTRLRGPSSATPAVVPTAARWSFAEGLLRRGVRSMLGTSFVVNDDAARDFALGTYGGLLRGLTLGLAVRDARARLFGAGRPDWANFVLYGDHGLTL